VASCTATRSRACASSSDLTATRCSKPAPERSSIRPCALQRANCTSPSERDSRVGSPCGGAIRLESENLLDVAAQRTARLEERRPRKTQKERRHCRPVSVRRHLITPERHRQARGRSRPVSPNTFDAVDCAPAPAASAARTPPRGYSCRTSGVSRARRSAGRDRSSGSPAGAAARARPRTNRRRWNEGVKRSPVPPARVRPGRSDVRVPPSRRTASARPGNARHLWQRPS